MIRILDRLIATTFLRIFALFIIGAPLLFIVGNLVEYVDRYFDRGLTVGEVALAYLYQVPEYVSWSFPIAALLAAVFTIHTMTQHREVMAAKAGSRSEVMGSRFTAGTAMYSARPPSSPVMPYSV